jgi:Metallo-beta-lactamase superfamily
MLPRTVAAFSPAAYMSASSFSVPTSTHSTAMDTTRSVTASEIVLIGTGVSTALPRISCILRGTLRGAPGNRQYVPCSVCQCGSANPLSPNRRCNVSALVRVKGSSVLIDVGKTAREACIRHFPILGVRTVDAVVLTHGHADAVRLTCLSYRLWFKIRTLCVASNCFASFSFSIPHRFLAWTICAISKTLALGYHLRE